MGAIEILWEDEKKKRKRKDPPRDKASLS